MVRLVSLLKRKEGTTHEEFLAHWRDRHGPLIAASSAARYVRRYEQHPVVWPPADSREPEPPFDGVTIQEFDSVESFHAHLAEPDVPAMLDDVARFLDPSALQWVICDEPTVVIDRS